MTTMLTFEVSTKRRTMAGLVLPYGQVSGRTGGQRFRFERGSLSWPSDAARVPLLMGHDQHRAVGRALWLESKADGVFGSFLVARTRDGDELLSLASDEVITGLSAGPRVLDEVRDPVHAGVQLVRRAELVEVSAVALPAFGEARISDIAASMDLARGLGGWSAPQPARRMEIVNERHSSGFSVGGRWV